MVYNLLSIRSILESLRVTETQEPMSPKGLMPLEKHPAMSNPRYGGKVGLVPIPFLKKYQGNKLRSTPEEMEELKSDIKKNGLKEPVVMSVGQKDRTATVGEGNHRVEALRQLGYTHAPVHVTRYQNAGGKECNQMSKLPKEDYFPANNHPDNVFDHYDT